MHLLVLGAFGHKDVKHLPGHDRRLNAPSGAGCFLTGGKMDTTTAATEVLMHLVVLGAFGPDLD